MPSPYEVLQVVPTADEAEIRRAWRRLARIYHPDRNAGDADAVERFQAIVAAYQLLGDAERRRAYDRETAARHAPRAEAGPASVSGRRGRIPERAVCVGIEYAVNVRGGVVHVPAPGVGRCDRCAGRGRVAGAVCSACGGVALRVAAGGGAGSVPACPTCRGEGHEAVTCDRCGGGGLAEPARVHAVRVEAGVGDGAVLRIPNAGWPGLDGERGDLVVRLTFDDPPGVRREDATLLVEARVRKSVAHLGGLVTVPGAEGPHEFRLPPKTPDGARLTFAGLGLRAGRDGGRGNLVVTIRTV